MSGEPWEYTPLTSREYDSVFYVSKILFICFSPKHCEIWFQQITVFIITCLFFFFVAGTTHAHDNLKILECFLNCNSKMICSMQSCVIYTCSVVDVIITMYFSWIAESELFFINVSSSSNCGCCCISEPKGNLTWGIEEVNVHI